MRGVTIGSDFTLIYPIYLRTQLTWMFSSNIRFNASLCFENIDLHIEFVGACRA